MCRVPEPVGCLVEAGQHHNSHPVPRLPVAADLAEDLLVLGEDTIPEPQLIEEVPVDALGFG